MNICKNCNTHEVYKLITITAPHVNRQIGLCVHCSRAKTRGWLKIEVQARKIAFIQVVA